MDLRDTFDSEAERYDRARPGYPDELFDDMAELTSLGRGARVLEIGPGTGQATRSLLARGYRVTAIEPGKRLAAVLRRNAAGLPCDVQVTRFEDWTLPTEPFDAVFAATSFHWLDAATRLECIAAVLRPGGALVIVDTAHVAGGTSAFFVRMQECYERHMPGTEPGLTLAAPDSMPDDEWGIAASPLFEPPAFRRYLSEIEYTTAGFVDVINTYSNHIALERPSLEALCDCIAALIDREFGGRIAKMYQRRMMVARRR